MSNNNEQQVEQLQRLVIKEEFYVLTGNHFAAALLNNMIFWQGISNKHDVKVNNKIANLERSNVLNKDKKIKSLKDSLRYGWFYKTNEDWLIEVMNWSSISTIHRRIKEFAKNGWVETGNNPDPKKKWDRTTWYKVNLDKIASDLHELGYALEGYTLYKPKEEIAEEEIEISEEKQEGSAPSSIFHDEKCILHSEISNISHDEKCILHGDKTIPESINHKVLTESNNRSLSIGEQIDALDMSDYIKGYLRNNENRLTDDIIKVVKEVYNMHLVEDETVFVEKLESPLEKKLAAKPFKKYFTTSLQNSKHEQKTVKQPTGRKIVREELVPDWLNEEDAPKEEKSKSREVLLEEATIMLDIQPDKLKPAHFKILEQEGLWDEAVQDAFEKSTADLRERLQKHDKVSVAN